MSAQCPKAIRRPTDRRVEVCCATKTLSSPANKLRIFDALWSLDLRSSKNLWEARGLSRAGSGALFSVGSCSTGFLRACIDRESYDLRVEGRSAIGSAANQK